MEPWRLSDDANALLSADERALEPRPPPPPTSLAAWEPDTWMLSEDAHTLLRAVADTPPMPAPSRGPAAGSDYVMEMDPIERSLSTRSWDRDGVGLGPPPPGHALRLGDRLYSA